MVENQSASNGSCPRFARGGPIYVPDLVSPITRVFEFQSAVIQELQSLEVELGDAADCDDELSVDELKVLTEGELVEKALKEDFNLPEGEGVASELARCSSEEMVHNGRNSFSFVETATNVSNNMDFFPPTDNSSSSNEIQETRGMEGSQQNLRKRKKRGRVFDRDVRAAALEGSYFTNVERLAKVLQRQNEDKAAARLHSFNGSCQPSEDCIAAITEKTEKMQALRFITTPLKVKQSTITENIPISYPEVVLSVEVYSRSRIVKKTQEFLVLGRQRLTGLRDQIYCLTDQLMQATGKYDTSGYFLIEDFFCNDLRDPSVVDYSEPILDWLRNCKSEAKEKWEYIMSGELKQKQKEMLGHMTVSNLPKLKAIDMHATRFCDLRFRLGAGYLYCHQGDCKHILVIRDMRLIHPEDDQNIAAYPLHTFQMKLRHRKCSVCDICMAKKMTVDDKWAHKNPCYFCDNCYFLLHYSKDGSLLYDNFTVYDYVHE